jgi:hypothetical protein
VDTWRPYAPSYIEDAHGRFERTAPTDEVFIFITDLVRPVSAYL